jgi:hypothetical protein
MYLIQVALATMCEAPALRSDLMSNLITFWISFPNIIYYLLLPIDPGILFIIYSVCSISIKFESKLSPKLLDFAKESAGNFCLSDIDPEASNSKPG